MYFVVNYPESELQPVKIPLLQQCDDTVTSAITDYNKLY